MVKTRHGMKVFAAVEAELELWERLVLSCNPESCDVRSPGLCYLASCCVQELAIIPSPLSQTCCWAELLRHAWFVYTTWTLDV